MKDIEKIRKLLCGKLVSIIHINNGLGIVQGKCHAINVSKAGFSITLSNGQSWDFEAETITEDYVEGPLRTMVGGRRRIQVREA